MNFYEMRAEKFQRKILPQFEAAGLQFF
jgi:hypothetical protein